MQVTPYVLAATSLFATEFGFGQVGEDSKAVELKPIVITASPFVERKDELVVPASKLTGEALRRLAESSLGATLSLSLIHI